ncbi:MULTISPECIES: type ISP restriction/modification enzyme [unclassified Microcystis]|uniref:type ISP restriction/modification enzyme n=1 Tax=unclassified Microcystis TaxID=2643300 RepID=UPI00258BBF3C|nr:MULTISPECIES: type ISP restriction/modification enzyme [unclassified Microcystis]MCA2761753.1 N-6 DNA methylase [Microcystis sp. M151S2]MCA2642178.1 N-6 DNA methylase [Microcystis sp. M087S2]MCA2670652.1 N-6 DNA methylase [Microcystis sp. M080S2]MCA2687814.1 N-6 DNA methylase [Microcystis sp. M037S2]MCA2734764.1 N-6 DNA methylase [Microcystis sp. M158S2]
MTNSLPKYLEEITGIYQQGNATEHSYRPALKKLIESLNNNLQALNEPKRIACGAPDFVINQGMVEIGHLEAKDIGTSLKKVENTPQIKRYLQALGNLIITDHLEFRWYVSGELRLSASVATLNQKKQIKPDSQGILQVEQMFCQFFLSKVIQITTPRELAKKMAALAQLIRDAIAQALKDQDCGGMLRQQLQSFQRVLISDLNEAQFADMYAQTICYGLFAARCNTDQISSFSRETAGFRLPKTNPFLRGIFHQIAGTELDERITWAVDTLATILQQTDMEGILGSFGKRTRKEDPVVHFYETFLAEYDSKMRESRGVYYTPEPVVSYMVRSVDYILKNKFQIPKGLADAKKITIKNPNNSQETQEVHQVLILDPAVGTGTFLHSVIDYIYESFRQQKGMWSSYVSQHLLPRLFGFELLMAPYTVAHMKLGLQLQELGYDFSADERLGIYLTNTLQEAFQIPPADGFLNRIRDEAAAAKDVKQEMPVMVILGNPPYSYQSMNTDPWIVNLVKDYYQLDGKPLGERNPKGLLDDYVKFIRFAQYRVAETGYGVVALITNHGYLDNPTFRGMRQNLMQTFDEIYVLDLHGNSKKKEICPDGSPDQNVFDIQQGVAIAFFIKYQDSQQDLAKVYHADLWGVREVKENRELVGGKYHWLDENDISSTEWEIIKPEASFYLLKNQNTALFPEYEKGWKIVDIMCVNSTGVKTHRDHFVFDFDFESLYKRIEKFRNLNIPENEICDKYNIQSTRDWKINQSRKYLSNNSQWEQYFIKCLYRPFDIRDYYHHEDVVELPRKEVTQHFFQNNNLGLCVSKGVEINRAWEHTICTDKVIQHHTVSLKETNYIFPLYLYPTNTPTLFETEPTNSPNGRRPNLAPEFIKELSAKLDLEFISDGKGDKKKTFGPEDIFNYIYAVFHSPQYRQRYAEFLKIDFPRVPLTSDKELFWELVKKGDRLVQLHLMKGTGKEISSYPVAGSNLVEQVKYDENKQQILINSDQYFAGIPPQIWNFYIGGYQVCQKWLKDRKGRHLSYDDLEHYQQIISILGESIAIMETIDIIINKYGGFPFS